MKRCEIVVHLKYDARHAHPDGVRVWFDPSESAEKLRESLLTIQRVLVDGGALYLPTSKTSTYWVHTRDVAGVEISDPDEVLS